MFLFLWFFRAGSPWPCHKPVYVRTMYVMQRTLTTGYLMTLFLNVSSISKVYKCEKSIRCLPCIIHFSRSSNSGSESPTKVPVGWTFNKYNWCMQITTALLQSNLRFCKAIHCIDHNPKGKGIIQQLNSWWLLLLFCTTHNSSLPSRIIPPFMCWST